MLHIIRLKGGKNMPSCRNCGARLSKFDKDICPVCGIANPLEGVNAETIEITSQVDLSNFKPGQKVVRRRKTMLLLSLLIGWTGAGFFYIKHKVFAIIWLLINLAVGGGLFALFYFLFKPELVLPIILPIAIIYIVNIIISLVYYFKKDLKDGEGEFVV